MKRQLLARIVLAYEVLAIAAVVVVLALAAIQGKLADRLPYAAFLILLGAMALLDAWRRSIVCDCSRPSKTRSLVAVSLLLIAAGIVVAVPLLWK